MPINPLRLDDQMRTYNISPPKSFIRAYWENILDWGITIRLTHSINLMIILDTSQDTGAGP